MACAVVVGLALTNAASASASVVFQANTNNLHVYTGGQVSTDTFNGMAAGTSPSVATLANGERIIAFQANTSRLMIRRADGSIIDTELGMKAGTSPSIAASPNGGYMVAMQSNLGQLYTYTPATGGVNTQQGMLADTNPSIAALSDGSYRVAFQSNITQLRVINGNGDPSTVVSTAYGLRDHTSPAIAAAPTGAGYAVAFQANTSALYTFTPTGGGVNTNQGMMAGTSPAIAWVNGGFKVAFQTNITQLRVIDADGNPNSVNNPPFGLNTRTSPTIAPAGNGSVQVAFTANTNELWTWTTGSSSGYNTLQGTNGLASPSIAFDAPNSFWFGGADVAVNTDAEADAVIAKLRSQSDADAPATWNGLTPTDQGYVRNRANQTMPSSVTYGGANWKVDTDAELTVFSETADTETDGGADLFSGLAPIDQTYAYSLLGPSESDVTVGDGDSAEQLGIIKAGTCAAGVKAYQTELDDRGALTFEDVAFVANVAVTCGGTVKWTVSARVCLQIYVGAGDDARWVNYAFRGDSDCESFQAKGKGLLKSESSPHLCYPGTHYIRAAAVVTTKNTATGKTVTKPYTSPQKLRECNNSGAWRWIATAVSGPSTALGNSLRANAEEPPGAPDDTRPSKGFEAHHIVPGNLQSRSEARILQAIAYSCENIAPNHFFNGVWLRGSSLAGPNDSGGPKPGYLELGSTGKNRAYHPSLHTNIYLNAVADALRPAVDNNYNCREADVQPRLNAVKNKLKTNDFPYGAAGSPLPDGID